MAGSIFIPLKTVLDNSGIKKTQSEFSKLGKSLKTALGAVGVGLSIGAITAQLNAAGKAAAQDAKSQALLATALRNTVGATNDQIVAVEESISKMESMSAVADDSIRPAFAQLTRATGDVAQATRLTNLALDVAAGTGRDVTSVAIALGRAYNGNTTALSRLGVNVKGVSDPLAALAKQFAGSAEAAADLDPYQRLQIVFGNLQEQIGTALLPYLNEFADFLNSPEGKETIDNFAASVKNLVTMMGNLAGVLNGAELKQGLASFAILSGVAAGNVDKNLIAETTRNLLNNIPRDAFGTFMGNRLDPGPALGSRVFTDLTQSALSAGSIRAIEEAAARAAKTAAQVTTGNNNNTTAQKKVSAAAKAAAEAIKAATKAADEQAKAYMEAAEAAADFMLATRKMVDGFRDLFKVTPELGAFEQAAVDAFSNIFDTIDSALSDGLILSGAASALREYAASERKTLQAIAKQRDVLAGKIDVARTITAGVTGLLSITNLLETSSRSVTETVRSIVGGIDVAVTKTFDVVESGGLVDNFQKLVDKTKAFAKNLVALKKLGLNKQLFAQLVQAGADAGGATAEAIVAGGSDTISALNGLYNELALSASDIAANATDTLYEVGQQIVSNGFIEGLLSQESELQQAAQTLADAFASTFTTQLQLAVDAVLPQGSSMIDQVAAVNLSGGGVGGRGTAFNAASAGRGTIFNVNVSAGVVTDPNGLARTVIDSVKKYERANGSVWVAA
jgi:nucleoid-associated protein YgaU